MTTTALGLGSFHHSRAPHKMPQPKRKIPLWFALVRIMLQEFANSVWNAKYVFLAVAVLTQVPHAIFWLSGDRLQMAYWANALIIVVLIIGAIASFRLALIESTPNKAIAALVCGGCALMGVILAVSFVYYSLQQPLTLFG